MKRKPQYATPVTPGTLAGMTFEPGDQVYVLGIPATVLTSYGLQAITDEAGLDRLEMGYLIRAENSKDGEFAPAWMVREYAHKQSHIKLVKSAVPAKPDTRIAELQAQLAELLAQAKPKGRK